MPQRVTREVVDQTRVVLTNPALREELGQNNYQLGLKYFSCTVARRKLAARMANLFGEGV